jgi:hypothetical protein
VHYRVCHEFQVIINYRTFLLTDYNGCVGALACLKNIMEYAKNRLEITIIPWLRMVTLFDPDPNPSLGSGSMLPYSSSGTHGGKRKEMGALPPIIGGDGAGDSGATSGKGPAGGGDGAATGAATVGVTSLCSWIYATNSPARCLGWAKQVDQTVDKWYPSDLDTGFKAD